MSVSVSVTRKMVYGTETLELSQSPSGGQMMIVDESIPDASTDLLVNFVADVSQTKAVWISSNKALTVKTNSSGSPAQTITLVADTPVLWVTGDAASNPLTADVTKLYVSNSSGAAATLKIRYVEDPTP